MAKANFKVSTLSFNNKLFDDLEKLLQFCKDYGYRYDERDVTNTRSNTGKQFARFLSGKPVKNMWDQDAEK